MAKGSDYAVQLQREYDDIASRSAGVTRSEEQRKAESDAYERMRKAEKSGAGRGQAKASAYKRRSKR